ncbi:hypothetical protein [Roseibium aggregatum]|uniref:Uncharacterized protein n=1 Tax=Roseibium aggregatum TaxID=187304 RepID=A0A926NW78_9HYPH|nr:hypothetical protein [Roseibium aggregatum]MBD1547519.1 hypothetical protein [Roseibium aggregatum]
MADVSEVESKRDQLIFWLVYSGFIVSGLIAISVIWGVLYLTFDGQVDDNGKVIIPDVLQNWGGIIVGFYFGTFVSLIKDYMKMK